VVVEVALYDCRIKRLYGDGLIRTLFEIVRIAMKGDFPTSGPVIPAAGAGGMFLGLGVVNGNSRP
jgi:hypothetical protein